MRAGHDQILLQVNFFGFFVSSGDRINQNRLGIASGKFCAGHRINPGVDGQFIVQFKHDLLVQASKIQLFF